MIINRKSIFDMSDEEYDIWQHLQRAKWKRAKHRTRELFAQIIKKKKGG